MKMTTKRIIASLISVLLLGIASISEAAPEWQATIWITSGDGKARLEIGGDPTATDGLDKAWDSYTKLGGSLRAYFPRPDWHPAFQKYWRDIRAKAQGTETEWTFVVESDIANSPLGMIWDLSLMPDDYPVFLIDEGTGQTIDMRTTPSYNSPYSARKNFRVKVYTPLEPLPPQNNPPVANAGPDQIVELASCDGATVTLNGSASVDPDGDPLSYVWTWDGGAAEGAGPAVTLPMGTTVITLTVDDGRGGSSSDTVKVSINDTTAATLKVTASPSVLWPANHKYVKVYPAVTVNDACIPTTKVEMVSVTSNEPDIGTGRGDLPNDIVINQDATILLRAERSDRGSGRVYSITYAATDMAGNQTTGTAKVTVPLNLNTVKK